MLRNSWIFVAVMCFVGAVKQASKVSNNVDAMVQKWLDEDFYPVYSHLKVASQRTSYMWAVNITSHNKEKMLESDNRLEQFVKVAAENCSKFDLDKINDRFRRRQLRRLLMSRVALSDAESTELNSVRSDMRGIYSTAAICPFGKNDCSKKWTLNGKLEEIMATSFNESLRRYVWSTFRDVVGPRVRQRYPKYVALSNKNARARGYKDYADGLKGYYEMDGQKFNDMLANLWLEVLPLYEELHAHVRRRLTIQYPDHINLSGSIPAHLLGNMWAHNWNSLQGLVAPYPEKLEGMDITTQMKRKGFTPLKMFKTGEKFFTSMGFPSLPDSFWNISLIEQPTDGRHVVCHGSAYDFYNGKDFAVKMCAKITHVDLNTIHHELGHIYYYLAYKDLPMLLRSGANPGFHEAIGNTILLSTVVPAYLHKIGLLETVTTDREIELNQLMLQSLQFIAFLPFGYIVDMWRWGVFNGSIPFNESNHAWWTLRSKYQGIHSPVPRSDDQNHFDPGAKYHIPSGTPYIRYFLSYFLSFQFHKALCEESDKGQPLHHCTLYGSKRAGSKFWRMLTNGGSTPWPDDLEMITGIRTISAEPIRSYFRPLETWLKNENKKHNSCYGWGAEWPSTVNLPTPRC